MNEREIINLFYSDSKPTQNKVDYLDDCSSLPGSSKEIVTTDSMVEGVHFRLDWSSPEDLAVKLFQMNMSDIISSGGSAKWCMLTIGLPKNLFYGFRSKSQSKSRPNGEKFLEGLSKTLRQECRRNKCPLIGGDTFRSSVFFLGLTMGGNAQRRISRSGGKAGDHLYLTGHLGLSLAGLQYLKGKIQLKNKAPALERHLRPQARVKWAKTLSMPMMKKKVHAMIDISDGLLANAIHLARASKLEISIQLEDIPLAPELSGKLEVKEAIVSGEELELLFLAEQGLAFPFPCRSIGRAERSSRGKSGVKLFLKNNEIPFPSGSFSHF